MPSYTQSNYTQLAPDEIREQIKQIIARDSAKLANTNYASYSGKTVSPMSSLTQRAQALEARRSAKGMPYGNSLNRFVNSPIKDISQDNIQDMTNHLGGRQLDFGRNVIGARLGKQFGQAADPYQDKFNRNLDKDTRLGLESTKGDLDAINTIARKFEGKKNTAVFGALSNSSEGKNVRQQRLTGDLYGYGQQKHGINNKILTGEKARFNAEKNEPYERLQNLQNALDGIGGEEDHPELSDQNAKQLQRALVAYGIDVGKPMEQWGQSDRIHTPTYSGKLVEPANAEMNTSYSLAEQISPSYQDKNYLDRKNLRKELVDSPNSVTKVIGELPGQLEPKFNLLDAEAKKKAKADMTALNAKFIKQGMYGGQSHIKAASNRMREINDATLGARSNALKTDLQHGIMSSNMNDINKLRKYNQYDQLANTEFNDTMGDIKRTNITGLEKWKNAQAGNEQLYKSYQNEKGYQQPRLLGNAHKSGYSSGYDGGIGVIEDHFANQGIKLSDISDLQGRYNDLEKELASNRAEIKTRNDYEAEKRRTEQDKKNAQINREAAERSRANHEWYRQEQIRDAAYKQSIKDGSFFRNQNNPGNVISTTGGYLDTPQTKVLNHPEILKRRMLNSQFNDYNYAKNYLDNNRLNY